MFFLGPFINWIKQLGGNDGGGRVFFFRMAAITLARFAAILPRCFEKLLFNSKIEATVIDKSPVFIIGHWRSGTTFLHNVMARDTNFAFITLTQCVAAEMFLTFGKLVNTVLKRRTPATRPMDNIFMSPDVPMEEEFAMANMGGGRSFYQHWIFPSRCLYYFNRYALFENISTKKLALWKYDYRRLLQKITLASGNKRLILKNPVNTARIKAILDLFPDAKFIHIYRNPFAVFPSTVNLHDKMIKMCGIQNIPPKQAEENILSIYEKMFDRYLSEKSLIPAGNLVEIRFEDFEANPIEQLERIYGFLNLPGFPDAEPAFREYIHRLGCYQKNTYFCEKRLTEQVADRWHATLHLWGYAGTPGLKPIGKGVHEKPTLEEKEGMIC